MHYYAIYCEDTPHSAEKRRSVRPAHIERLHTLEKANRLLVAGPLLKEDEDNDTPIMGGIQGSLIIAQFESLENAKAWAAADPYATAGVYQTIRVHPFKKVLPGDL